MPTAPRRFALPLLALLLAAPVSAQEANRNARFGLPGPVATNPKDPKAHESFLISRPQYVLSYNDQKRIPNWVCWELKKSDIGNAARGAFHPDPALPRGFTKIQSRDYTGSGFDRGHMCPAKDRSATQADCDATFYLANVLPQSPNCNRLGWERLEDYCRRLTREGHVLQIVSGPAGLGGVGEKGPAKHFGKNERFQVAVPAKVWKVIMVLPREDAKPRRNTRVIAVIMPNDQTVDSNWAKYRVSVREVEKLTGLTFFPEVDAEVAAAIKASPDDVKVRVPRPRRDSGKKPGGTE
jgi:endonuclease G